MEFISNIPASILFALLAFVASWAVHKHKIKELEKKTLDQKKEIELIKTLRMEDKDTFFKTREKDDKAINERFQAVDFQRERVKDIFTSKMYDMDKNMTNQMHEMDKKITEIHTIVTKK